MNWKLAVVAILSLAVGLSIAPFEHRTVLASTVPADAHFQIQSATVDEPNSEGQEVITHEVFLLDTDSGKVWKFQGLVWTHDKDGVEKVISSPIFLPVGVESWK
jgi:hypothetical protein